MLLGGEGGETMALPPFWQEIYWKKKNELLLKTKTIKKTKKKTDMYCNELETPLYVIPKIRQKWVSLVKLLIILIV